MASLANTLELQGGSGNFTFLVPPSFEPRAALEWKDAANPPQLTAIRWVWEFRGAMLVSSNGTTATLWTEFAAFLARFQTRGSTPTYARIVRDPAGANATVWTLGPSTYEGFKVEAIQAGSGNRFAQAESALWRVAIPVDLTISAVQKLPDGNGIVDWDQQVEHGQDEGGLQLVTWTTTITTKEASSPTAEALAQTYGLIPLAVYGDNYSYLTNSDTGVEVTLLDADQANSRQATRVKAVCRLRQWGVSIGTSGPGLGPSSVTYQVRTHASEDEETTTYFASAVGPGAQAWVLAKVPSGIAVTEQETVNRPSHRSFEATWIRKRKLKKDTTKVLTSAMAIEISGGRASFDYEPVAGGFDPVEFEGARSPWQVTVRLELRAVGGEGGNDDPTLILPPLAAFTALGLRLDYDASVEGEPRVEKDAVEAGAVEWARSATYVFRSARKPNTKQIRGTIEARADGQASYYL